MKNTITNKQAETLINKCFDSEGLLVSPKSRKNPKEVQALRDSGYDGYGEMLDGFDVYTSLLIILNPNREI